MSIQPPLPRHTVENQGDLVRVTLPAKKSIFQIMWTTIWLIWYCIIFFMVLFIVFQFYRIYELEKITSTGGQATNLLIFTSLFFLPFYLMLVGFGAFGLQTFFWLLVGKEIIEANSATLKITRQIFSKKKTREYFAQDVKDLRIWEKHSLFESSIVYRKIQGEKGVIAFDYGAKTIRFGSKIDEAEAKLIISEILDGLAN
jgi:uncharacterized membrane protein